MNPSSHLFLEITKDIAEKILFKGLNGKKLESMTLLKGGMFNTTYLLTYDGDQKVILRLGPVNRQRLLDFECHLMEMEKETYRRMKAAGVPCGQILYYDKTMELADREFQLMEYVDGRSMLEVNPGGREEERLYEEAGNYARILHSMTADSFGTVYQVANGKGFLSWFSFLFDFLQRTLEKGMEYGAFSDSEARAALSYMASKQSLFDQVRKPSFLHTDLWCGNILVKDGNIAAVIDADRAVWGDVDMEFGSGWMINDAFLRGYGLSLKEYQSPLRQQKMQIYKWIFDAMEVHIGKAEYQNEMQYREKKEAFLKLL